MPAQVIEGTAVQLPVLLGARSARFPIMHANVNFKYLCWVRWYPQQGQDRPLLYTGTYTDAMALRVLRDPSCTNVVQVSFLPSTSKGVVHVKVKACRK